LELLAPIAENPLSEMALPVGKTSMNNAKNARGFASYQASAKALYSMCKLLCSQKASSSSAQ
jgi:hypothetical protein